MEDEEQSAELKAAELKQYDEQQRTIEKDSEEFGDGIEALAGCTPCFPASCKRRAAACRTACCAAGWLQSAVRIEAAMGHEDRVKAAKAKVAKVHRELRIRSA